MKIKMTTTILTPKLRITKSEYPFKEPQGGFDLRIVRYEKIHSIKDKDFDELFKIINVQESDTILDAGCGYGSVSREILKRSNVTNLKLILYDLYELQLKRAIPELNGFFNNELENRRIKLIHGDLRKISLKDASVDKIIAKMVIHEIPVADQGKVFKEFYRVLRPGGKLIIWDTNLKNSTQLFFQSVIRKKDELAEYNHLYGTRYFLREEEMQKLATEANFQLFRKTHTIEYTVNTGKRLIPEFAGDLNKLSKWNTFIRKLANELPTDVLEELQFQDKEKTIEFNVEKAIFTCYK